jgi:di/tricarboxylate transporter
MTDAAIVFLVLAAVVVLFVWNKLPVEIVAIGSALTLAATGVLTVDQAIAGFGDSTVIFIAALFVVSEGIDSTGVTTWAGQQLIARAGDSRVRLIVLMMILVAVLTALISVNGAVAALLPMVVVVALRVGQTPSKLLMPLAFAAHAGSMLALTGTPVHILISQASVDAGYGPFGYFEFGLVGVPLVIGAVAIVVLFGSRLLPDRKAQSIPPDLSDHARTLIRQYSLEVEGADSLINRQVGVVEVVIPPRSEMIGVPVFPGMVTSSGDFVVLAVQRKGEDIESETVLAVGDSMLLQGTWDALGQGIPSDSGVLVVDHPELVRRQTVPMGPGATRALVILGGMVVMLATGIVPPVVAALLAAGALILTRVLTMYQAYRAISWTTVILVGGMIPLSTAVQQSGAAEDIAQLLIKVVGDSSPYLLLLALFLLTAVLGQLISNMATALVVIPIAVTAAADLGVSARPVLMSLTVAAAAAFLTPVATPANLMVMGPAGYRFADYWKLGLPMLLLFLLVSVFLVPVFWPF